MQHDHFLFFATKEYIWNNESSLSVQTQVYQGTVGLEVHLKCVSCAVTLRDFVWMKQCVRMEGLSGGVRTGETLFSFFLKFTVKSCRSRWGGDRFTLWDFFQILNSFSSRRSLSISWMWWLERMLNDKSCRGSHKLVAVTPSSSNAQISELAN